MEDLSTQIKRGIARGPNESEGRPRPGPSPHSFAPVRDRRGTVMVLNTRAADRPQWPTVAAGLRRPAGDPGNRSASPGGPHQCEQGHETGDRDDRADTER